jgi:hypothetical protein
MAELIHECETKVEDAGGVIYSAAVHGEGRADGTWVGWIEFRPASGDAPVLRTGQETSQPDRGALAYWASGLEPVYIDGAFSRAR